MLAPPPDIALVRKLANFHHTVTSKHNRIALLANRCGEHGLFLLKATTKIGPGQKEWLEAHKRGIYIRDLDVLVLSTQETGEFLSAGMDVQRLTLAN
jgi:hypothetical protein